MKAFLDYASSKYYAGEPIISDEEFDSLVEYYGYDSVGSAVTGDSIAHAFPMWSLQKVYDDEDPIVYYGCNVIESPKLDGAAVANYYAYGKHFLSLTRGDGKKGLDITDKMSFLIPKEIPFSTQDEPLTQITGEVVAPKHIENARNYSAGALNLKDIEEFKKREVSFVAYGIIPNIYSTWSEDIEKLSYFGFNTVLDLNMDTYPQDGKVYRVDEYTKFNEMGYTSKHPRAAFALKERKAGVITKLLDVIWQVGRSGIVSPVAILEPVMIGGAKISRATLHNYKYIEELDLDYNCLVEVVRSGEIIPRVVRRIYE